MPDAKAPPPPDATPSITAPLRLATDGLAGIAADAVGRSLSRAFAEAVDLPLSPRLAALLRQLE